MRKKLGAFAAFCLAGILSLCKIDNSQAQVLADANKNYIQAGAQNTSSEWSYGPIYNSSGFYIQVGRGVNNSLTPFFEVSAETPVINEGYTRPNQPEDKEEKRDVSPNHQVTGLAFGLRGKLYETPKKRFALCSEARYSKLAGFDELFHWDSNERTEIRTYGLTTLSGALWTETRLGNLNFRLGAGISSSSIEGSAMTYTVNSSEDVKKDYEYYHEADKNHVEGIVGMDYTLGKNWTLSVTERFPSWESINIGFARKL